MSDRLIEFDLVPAGEAQVEFLDEPPAHPAPIHERRFCKEVPEGKDEQPYILHGVPELN